MKTLNTPSRLALIKGDIAIPAARVTATYYTAPGSSDCVGVIGGRRRVIRTGSGFRTTMASVTHGGTS